MMARIALLKIYILLRLLYNQCLLMSSVFFYSTGKDEVYIKTDGGKRRMKIHELQIEMHERNRDIRNKSS